MSNGSPSGNSPLAAVMANCRRSALSRSISRESKPKGRKCSDSVRNCSNSQESDLRLEMLRRQKCTLGPDHRLQQSHRISTYSSSRRWGVWRQYLGYRAGGGESAYTAAYGNAGRTRGRYARLSMVTPGVPPIPHVGGRSCRHAQSMSYRHDSAGAHDRYGGVASVPRYYRQSIHDSLVNMLPAARLGDIRRTEATSSSACQPCS